MNLILFSCSECLSRLKGIETHPPADPSPAYTSRSECLSRLKGIETHRRRFCRFCDS